MAKLVYNHNNDKNDNDNNSNDYSNLKDCYTLLVYSSISLVLKLASNTAQGRGGSVQNRTAIGEVVCCESWMAECLH